MVLAKPIYGRAVIIFSRNIQNIWSLDLSCAALRHNGRNFAEIVIDGSIGRGPVLAISCKSGTSARTKRFSETGALRTVVPWRMSLRPRVVQGYFLMRESLRVLEARRGTQG
jgi:hypothetical protein